MISNMKLSCLLFILELLRGSHSFHKRTVSKPGIARPPLPLVGPVYASFIDEVDLGAVNSGLGSETLLYADDDIIVMNKAPNSQTAPGYMTKESLAGSVALEYNIERVDQMIVHRLDHGTSGIVVFARNVEALRNLHAQFRKKHVQKEYVARVLGVPSSSGGEINLPIMRDMDSRPRMKIHPDGRASVTVWNVVQGTSSSSSSNHNDDDNNNNNNNNNKLMMNIDHNKRTTLLALRPHSGRTHQLRVHLALGLGLPILGDYFYASPDVCDMAPRLCLHAKTIQFAHPRTHECMRFDTETPF